MEGGKNGYATVEGVDGGATNTLSTPQSTRVQAPAQPRETIQIAVIYCTSQSLFQSLSLEPKLISTSVQREIQERHNCFRH